VSENSQVTMNNSVHALLKLITTHSAPLKMK
jgi:hypothetical protein